MLLSAKCLTRSRAWQSMTNLLFLDKSRNGKHKLLLIADIKPKVSLDPPVFRIDGYQLLHVGSSGAGGLRRYLEAELEP
jgi:hypothetical protein